MNSLRGRTNNRQLVQHFVRRLQSLQLHSSSVSSTITDSVNSESEIRVPFRKERNATDVLQALEKTIQRDHTAAHYKFMDDPWFIPLSNRAKRSYALSKESGRKAAMWIHKEHANLFDDKLSEPEIKQFMPKAQYETKEDVSEKLLVDTINEGNVTDALMIYKLLDKDISIESKQALLELLCFYNSEEQLSDELLEERWYRKAVQQQIQCWAPCHELEELFQFLKKQDKPIATAAYNALICGTAKFLQIDKAWALFEECEEKGIPLSLLTYNHIIQLVPILRDSPELRQSLMLEIFGKIKGAGLRPDIQTFNSSLKVASMIQAQRASKTLVKSLFKEFKDIGIEPSLASYYFVLVSFYKDRRVQNRVIYEIMNELKDKTFTMQDPNDTLFFVTAMDVARNFTKDPQLAERIHELLLTGENYNFIGEGNKESIYYRHYMILLLETIPFKEFMQTYDILVPNVYVPEPGVVMEILKAIELADQTLAQDVLPRLWSQMVMFEHIDREQLATKAIHLMRTHCAPSIDSPINKQYAANAWTYWQHAKVHAQHRMQRHNFNGEVLADMAILSLRGDEFDRFLIIVDKMIKDQNSIVGTADIEQLEIMLTACLERGHAPGALAVLQCAVEAGFLETSAMARKIKATIPLTAAEESQLCTLVGAEVLEMVSASDEKIYNKIDPVSSK